MVLDCGMYQVPSIDYREIHAFSHLCELKGYQKYQRKSNILLQHSQKRMALTSTVAT